MGSDANQWEDDFSTIYDDTAPSKPTITFDSSPPSESQPPNKRVEIKIVKIEDEHEHHPEKENTTSGEAGERRKSIVIVRRKSLGRRKSIAKPSKMHSRIFLVYKSIVFLIFLIGLLGLMIAMIIMGARYEDKCPFNKNIPLWLILFGTVGLVFVIVKICSSIFARFVHEESHHVPQILTVIGFLTSLIGFFLLVLLVIGSVWIYNKTDLTFEELDSETMETSKNYCDKTAYYFAFWSITSVYIIIGLICIIGCLIVIITGIMDEAEAAAAARE